MSLLHQRSTRLADFQLGGYRAPDVLGGTMIEGGEASPVVSVAPDPDSGRQFRLVPMPSGTEPGGQGKAVPALPPALLVAAGPVVPVPGTLLPVADVPGAVVPVPGVGEATTFALLPVRPVAPTPAPVLGALLVLPVLVVLPPVLPPVVCPVATADAPSNSAAATGRVLASFMQTSHILYVMRA